MPIHPRKVQDLKKRMDQLQVKEEDLLEKFILGSGKGGQKVNKTHSCVYLKHLPTGIEIKYGKERSREMNRFFARRQLLDELEGVSKIEEEKIRKQKKQKKRRKRRQTKTDS